MPPPKQARPVTSAALALPARARADLPLGVLLARVPDPRTDRRARHPARRRVPRRRSARASAASARYWYAPTLLWLGAGDARAHGCRAAGSSARCCWSPTSAPRLTVALCTLLFLSFIAALQDFSSLPVRRDAARGGVPLALLRAARPSAGARRDDPPSRVASSCCAGSGSGSTSSRAW